MLAESRASRWTFGGHHATPGAEDRALRGSSLRFSVPESRSPPSSNDPRRGDALLQGQPQGGRVTATISVHCNCDPCTSPAPMKTRRELDDSHRDPGEGRAHVFISFPRL